MHTEAQQVTTKTPSSNSRFRTRIQGIGTNFTSLSFITTTKPDAIDRTTGEASSILSRKENNCHISIVGINSNDLQVAPRTTREDPTAISLTHFFSQCRIPGTCFPGKGGVKEMPVIASLTALTTPETPEGTKFTHIYLV